MSDDGDRMIGPAEFSGGRVASFAAREGAAHVFVHGTSGNVYRLGFSGVRSLRERRAEGMQLHALIDRPARRGGPRTFTFVGEDAAADACLEIVATDVTIEPAAAAV